jgi:hypothetical protein
MHASVAGGYRHPSPAQVPVLRGSGGAHRRQSKVSVYLKSFSVSHWLLLLYPIVMHAVARQRAPEQVFEVDPAAMVQIGFTAVCALYALTRVARRGSACRLILTRKPLFWMMCYVVLALFSTVWSHRPEFTLYRAAELTVFLVLSVDAMVRARGVEAMIKFQMVFAAVFVILGMVLESGFTIAGMHSSEVPGTVVAVVFLGFLVKGWLWRSLYAIVLAGVLFGTSSATFVSILVGVGVLMLALRGRWAATGWLVLAAVVATAVATNFDLDRYVFWGKSEQEVRTGSGRLFVWDWVIRERVSQEPVLGFGFGVGETLARLSDPSESTLQMMYMHSAGMSALTNLGAVGVLLLLLLLIGIWRGAWSLSRTRLGPTLVGATAALFVNAQMVASVTSTMSSAVIGHGLFLSMVAVASLMGRRQRAVASRKVIATDQAGLKSRARLARGAWRVDPRG